MASKNIFSKHLKGYKYDFEFLNGWKLQKQGWGTFIYLSMFYLFYYEGCQNKVGVLYINLNSTKKIASN